MPTLPVMPDTLRRCLILSATAASLASVFAGAARAAAASPAASLAISSAADPGANAASRLAQLEREAGGRLGVAARHTGTGATLSHRADERFPLCSTFKLVLAGAVLHRQASDAGLLQRRLRYGRDDLVAYSPITEKHVDTGMTVAELCAAALQYSDNSAANALLRLLGGPDEVTAFARDAGDTTFRLDRWETSLNTALPGDPRDTSTPAAMSALTERLVLGDLLPVPARAQLQDWLRGNTTGARRIRAGLPAGWQVGDKTGSGDYGTSNDIAVAWPAGGAAVVIAVYYTQAAPEAKWRDDVIAAAARIVAGVLA